MIVMAVARMALKLPCRLLYKHRHIFQFLIAAWLFMLVVITTMFMKSDENHGQKVSSTGYAGNFTAKSIPQSAKELVSKYCNSPTEHEPMPGDEGKAEDGLTLRSVQIIIRHGDRAPLKYIPQLKNIICGIPNVSRYKILQTYMEFIKAHNKTKHRHFSQFPKVPQSLKCIPNFLTNIGVLQHLYIGELLRKKYVDQLHLIQATDKVVVKSTLYSRTYQSALAFLYKFLPNSKFLSLEINPIQNVRFCTKHLCHCPNLDRYFKEVNQASSKRLKKHYLLTEMLTEMNSAMDLQNNTLAARAMFDTLMAFSCHQAELPCSHSNCVQKHQLYKLTSFLNMSEKQRIFSSAFLKYSYISMFPLLSDIHAIMSRFEKPTGNVEKFVLYSGHDVTLSPLLAALGFHDDFIPPYASRVIFELYSNKMKQYYIKVIYNGKDMTRRVRFCQNNKLCPLKFFTKFIEMDMFNFIGAITYEEACTSKNTTDNA